MKPPIEPRAVLAGTESPSFAMLREGLTFLGIEPYTAPSVATAVQNSLRSDTLLVVFDTSAFGVEAVRGGIAAIRQHPQAHDVLLGVLLDPEHGGTLEEWQELGVDSIETLPLTRASAARLIWRMAKRPHAAPQAPAGTEAVDPQEELRKAIARRQGRLKIYLGAAPGVGKTYAMLREAHELHGRGEDVVIGLVETHGRRETAILTEGLPEVPRKVIDYKGTQLTEMDLDALLERRPEWALVDELAHTNVPGSLNAKRCEDVQLLRMMGISVISTLNIQHLESLNSIVERITGIKVRETVPDGVLEEADEVVLVDISPETLLGRLQAGKIYAPEKVTQALSNFFTTHNLTALRELVLRELADKVDERLEAVRADIGRAFETTGIVERVLICITPTSNAPRLIRRGIRMADRLNAETTVLYVENHGLSSQEKRALDQAISLAESLEAHVAHLKDQEPGEAIARYAHDHRITMIMLGESRRPRWQSLWRKPILETVLHETQNIDVVLVATHEGD